MSLSLCPSPALRPLLTLGGGTRGEREGERKRKKEMMEMDGIEKDSPPSSAAAAVAFSSCPQLPSPLLSRTTVAIVGMVASWFVLAIVVGATNGSSAATQVILFTLAFLALTAISVAVMFAMRGTEEGPPGQKGGDVAPSVSPAATTTAVPPGPWEQERQRQQLSFGAKRRKKSADEDREEGEGGEREGDYSSSSSSSDVPPLPHPPPPAVAAAVAEAAAAGEDSVRARIWSPRLDDFAFEYAIGRGGAGKYPSECDPMGAFMADMAEGGGPATPGGRTVYEKTISSSSSSSSKEGSVPGDAACSVKRAPPPAPPVYSLGPRTVLRDEGGGAEGE